MTKQFPIKSISANAFLCLTLVFVFFSQFGFSANWQPINTTTPLPIKINLVSSTIKQSTITCTVSGFNIETIKTDRGVQSLIDVEEGIPLFEKGAPDVRRISASLLIPNRGNMEVRVVSSQFKDYENIEIAPSKGVLDICADPTKIAFEYGEAYQKNEFYPGKLSELREAHIMRNVRGQVVDIYPFQYNPVTKTLRVYYNMVIETVVNETIEGENCIYNTDEQVITAPFKQIYESNYINFSSEFNPNKRALAADANGRMLVICFDGFEAVMKPFVDWKIQKGIETELVKVSTIGGKAADIKAYIQKYYTAHPDLTYLVLVGDHQQIPTTITGNDSHGSDNAYTKLNGTDSYPEIIAGRISATTEAEVKLQVKKFLTYEAMPSKLDPTRFNTGTVSSLKVGPDNSTAVYKDMVDVKSTLTTTGGYTYCSELYESGAGGSTIAPTAANVSAEFNKGIGFASWICHGMETQLASWKFSTANVSKLTNTKMWPTIWNCSCLTGKFHTTGTCFAESLLRAKQGDEPTGAIACAMSTRNMPMGPSEKYANAALKMLFDNTRKNKSYGSITFDTYIKVGIDAYKMAIEFSCMVIFGDPSIELRTKAPMALTATHNQHEQTGVSNIVVNCNAEGAYIALTMDGKIIGTGYVTGGKVDIKLKDPVNKDAIITVTGTNFNYAPYIGQVAVGNATGIKNVDYNNVFSVYPNPNAGKFIIVFNNPTANYQLEIKNTLGQSILQEKIVGQASKECNVNQYGKGIYFVSLTDNAGNRAVKNIVVD